MIIKLIYACLLALTPLSNSLTICQEVGNLTLINSSNSNWIRTDVKSNQMKNWEQNFPLQIDAYSSKTIEIIWKKRHASEGRVTYNVEHTNSSFEISAKLDEKKDYNVSIHFKGNLKTQTLPEKSVLSLGWNKRINIIKTKYSKVSKKDIDVYRKTKLGFRKKQNGNVTFILSGIEGHYSSTGLNGDTWMQDNFMFLRSKTIKEITLPGAHDAGASVLGSNGGLKTFFSNKCNTKTQSLSIKGQLEKGVRYFDIRPYIYHDKYYTGHFSDISGKWIGSTGQSIESMVNDINEFTKTRRELIILGLSHFTNLKRKSFGFTEEERKELSDQLSKIKHLKETKLEAPLNDLISSNSVVMLTGLSSSTYEVKNGGWFAWTCIKQRAKIKNQLAAHVAYHNSDFVNSNVIMYDYIRSTDVAALAMALNWYKNKTNNDAFNKEDNSNDNYQ